MILIRDQPTKSNERMELYIERVRIKNDNADTSEIYEWTTTITKEYATVYT